MPRRGGGWRPHGHHRLAGKRVISQRFPPPNGGFSKQSAYFLYHIKRTEIVSISKIKKKCKENNIDSKCSIIYSRIREAAKKFLFSGPATKALSPTSLVATFVLGLFFRASKRVFLLSDQALKIFNP